MSFTLSTHHWKESKAVPSSLARDGLKLAVKALTYVFEERQHPRAEAFLAVGCGSLCMVHVTGPSGNQASP